MADSGKLNKFFSPGDLQHLVQEARESPRRRRHVNIHSSYGDPSQRLLNALEPDSYIQPHRHSLDRKEETLLAVRGLFALVTFRDRGAVAEIVRFGSEKHGGGDSLAVGVTVPPDAWHTVIALYPGSILLEIKAGPFDPDTAKELADWAPTERSPESAMFMRGLLQLANRAQVR